MPWEQDYGEAQAPAAGAMPWEKDYGRAAPAEDKGTFLHPKKPTGTGWRAALERITQYPGIALGQINDAGETLGKVSRGEIDATSPEAIKASTDFAMMASPGAEAAGTGAQLARRAGLGKVAPGAPTPGFRPPPPNMETAQTAADIGAPLPAGLVSNTTGVPAATQAARQLPFVGQNIDDRVAATIGAAGGKVNEIATDLTGGHVPDRAVAGANTRSSLESVIESNNGKIDQTYNDLRTNFIEGHKFAALPNTRTALDAVIKNRRSAGIAKPEAGLDDVTNLLTSGRSFNGLVRARSQVGKVIGLAKNNPNPGFDVGDFKRLYAAMSGDMENVVRANARTGVNPVEAVAALRSANAGADEIIGHNANIQRLLNVKSDERLVGSVINSANDKTGNARLLYQLRNQMPKQDFEEIVGVGMSELGHNPATNQFSLNKFAKGWNDMGDFAKSTLISDPAHRKALDDIAKLGGFLKDADKYVNTSNTGRAATLGGLIGAGGTALASMDPAKILGVLGIAGGGALTAKILARPATASALRKWATIAADKNTGRWGPARQSLYGIATRNLLTNLRDLPGVSGDQSGLVDADRQPPSNPPIPRARPQTLQVRKIQDRAPVAVR
jgi:hypothetical protein